MLKTILLFLSLSLDLVSLQPGFPVFVRTCLNPLILAHTNYIGHSYCFHACGFLADSANDTSTCESSGNCVCNYPTCSDSAFQKLSSDLCPPGSIQPADPDPDSLTRCIDTCALRCPGGQGEICGEITRLAGNSFAKICVCHCPPNRCNPLKTTIGNISYPDNQANQNINSFENSMILNLITHPVKFLYKLLTVKFIFKHLFKIGLFLLMKVCSLFGFIKLVTLG